MASSNIEGAPCFAIVSHSHSRSKLVVGKYASLEEAREARKGMMDTSLHPWGYVEDGDYFWISYGDTVNDEVHYFVEEIAFDKR